LASRCTSRTVSAICPKSSSLPKIRPNNNCLRTSKPFETHHRCFSYDSREGSIQEVRLDWFFLPNIEQRFRNEQKCITLRSSSRGTPQPGCNEASEIPAARGWTSLATRLLCATSIHSLPDNGLISPPFPLVDQRSKMGSSQLRQPLLLTTVTRSSVVILSQSAATLQSV